jgi:hypothetical protein
MSPRRYVFTRFLMIHNVRCPGTVDATEQQKRGCGRDGVGSEGLLGNQSDRPTTRHCTTEPTVYAGWASSVGEFFDRSKTSHPVDYGVKCDAEIAYLAVVLRLLRAREQARSQ